MRSGANGRLLASGNDDGTIQLWAVDSTKLVDTLHGHQGPVWRVRYSPDGTVLASGGNGQVVKLWDTKGYKRIHTLQGHSGCINAIGLGEQPHLLVSGGEDGFVQSVSLGEAVIQNGSAA